MAIFADLSLNRVPFLLNRKQVYQFAKLLLNRVSTREHRIETWELTLNYCSYLWQYHDRGLWIENVAILPLSYLFRVVYGEENLLDQNIS